jgi:hypothetical protein
MTPPAATELGGPATAPEDASEQQMAAAPQKAEEAASTSEAPVTSGSSANTASSTPPATSDGGSATTSATPPATAEARAPDAKPIESPTAPTVAQKEPAAAAPLAESSSASNTEGTAKTEPSATVAAREDQTAPNSSRAEATASNEAKPQPTATAEQDTETGTSSAITTPEATADKAVAASRPEAMPETPAAPTSETASGEPAATAAEGSTQAAAPAPSETQSATAGETPAAPPASQADSSAAPLGDATAQESSPRNGQQPSPQDAQEEPPKPVEITGLEATTTGSTAASAEASVEAFDLADLSVGGTEEKPLASSGEAAPGIPDARDVTIRAAEVEAGNLYVAGEAPAGSTVRIYANDVLVGEVRTSNDGAWLLEAQKDVPVGEIVFRVEAVPKGVIGQSAVAEASKPFMHYDDGIVLEPVVTAMAIDNAEATDASLAPTPSYVIIRRGDNLWRIARRNYGRGVKYQAIFAANRELIRNPHWIFPGQVFVVPTRDRRWEAAAQ